MTFADSLMLVTGAASGIGRAVVNAAVQKGARVAALDVADEPGDDLARLPGVTYFHCDVSDPAAWADVAREVQALGGLRYVHLNAGIQIAPPNAPLDEYRFAGMQLDRYRKMMGVNVDGVVFGLQALVPLVADGGSIVVTSSLAGITPYDVDPLYAMSKHAVSGLVRSLGPELSERNLTINAICPGGIDTAIIPHEQRTEASKFMSTEHVADEVLFLMDVETTGKTWAKVAESKPVFIIRAPGDREPAKDG